MVDDIFKNALREAGMDVHSSNTAIDYNSQENNAQKEQVLIVDRTGLIDRIHPEYKPDLSQGRDVGVNEDNSLERYLNTNNSDVGYLDRIKNTGKDVLRYVKLSAIPACIGGYMIYQSLPTAGVLVSIGALGASSILLIYSGINESRRPLEKMLDK